jgi:hypothetical protein
VGVAVLVRFVSGAAVAAVTALSLAPAAHAITQGELDYITDMTAAGMGPPVDVPLFLGAGYRICNDLNSGVSRSEAADNAGKVATGLSPTQTATMVGIAIKDLCPDQG